MYRTKNALGFANTRYFSLSDQPSDVLVGQQENAMTGSSFIINNKLSITVDVFLERSGTYDIESIDPGSTRKLCSVPPLGKSVIPSEFVQLNDLLHFKHTDNTNLSYFVTPSIRIKRRLGDVNIGSVVSATNGYNRDIHPNGDISSIKLHNMLPWPLYIYHNGALQIHIKENMDLGGQEHGNLITSPYVYYDNGNMGIKIGDNFQIAVDNDTKKSANIPKILYTFTITDRNVSEIFIGQGSTEVDVSMKPENYSYRLGVSDTTKGYSIKTTTNCKNTNNGGKAPYALGENELQFKNGNYYPKHYNAKGTDMVRQHGNRNPTSKYKNLSGTNFVSI